MKVAVDGIVFGYAKQDGLTALPFRPSYRIQVSKHLIYLLKNHHQGLGSFTESCRLRVLSNTN
jgi:hypothetical protein